MKWPEPKPMGRKVKLPTEIGYFHQGYSKKYLAHRLAWEINFGKIPIGILVCHRCDNPCCVNLEHLFLGTHKDNFKDSFNKNRVNPSQRAKERWIKCPTFRKTI